MFIYRLLFVLLSPVLLLHVVWKAAQCRQWQYFAQRLGFDYYDIPPGCIWFHCASVGEVKTILPLLDACHARMPEQHFLVTSNTATSREILLKHKRDFISHAYCPLDWRSSVSAFLNSVRPRCCFLIETELWANLIDLCQTHHVTVTILNGRLSRKTLNSQKWLLHTYRHILQKVDAVYTRNALDAEHYLQLGASAESTRSPGDLKFALPDTKGIEQQTLTKRDYLLVVSTHDDEEQQIAQACSRILANTLMVIAPRHPERGSSIAARLHRIGLNIAMHSKHDRIDNDTHVYLLDTIGELDKWYNGAQIVVVGGSFVDIGGHNIIEPLRFHKAVVYGPSMYNFTELHDIAQQYDAAVQVDGYAQLATQLEQWLHNKTSRKKMEQAAASLMRQFESTLPAYVDIVAHLAAKRRPL